MYVPPQYFYCLRPKPFPKPARPPGFVDIDGNAPTTSGHIQNRSGGLLENAVRQRRGAGGGQLGDPARKAVMPVHPAPYGQPRDHGDPSWKSAGDTALICRRRRPSAMGHCIIQPSKISWKKAWFDGSWPPAQAFYPEESGRLWGRRRRH